MCIHFFNTIILYIIDYTLTVKLSVLEKLGPELIEQRPN